MRRSFAVLATATTVAMVSGCAGTTSPQAASTSPAAVATSATPSAATTPAVASFATPVVHKIDDTANGSTLYAHVGDTVRVTLHSTYWEMDPPATSALRASDTAVAASLGPIPGTGTGTVVTSYLIVHSGSAKITAHRTSCGEALLCPPDMRTYVVSIAVAAN